MTSKLIWGMVGGCAIGAILGGVAGSTPIGIAICIAAGAIAAYVWHVMEQRKTGREGR